MEPAPTGPASGIETAGGAASKSDAEAMQQVMQELQSLGALDPAAQAALMADLRQTDPALWPMVVQQFRAALAYRRRTEARQLPAPGQSAEVQMASHTSYLGEEGDGQRGQGISGLAQRPADIRPGGQRAPLQMARLPVADNTALTPATAPRRPYPATVDPQTGPQVANRPRGIGQAPEAPQPAGDALAGRIVSDDWQVYLERAIRLLESRLQNAPGSPDEAAEQARLRLLYVLAGRRQEALEPIRSVAPAEQQFWSNELYGLATWLDTERTPDDTRRAAEAKQIFEEAIARLGESAPLVIRNLAFCTEVHSYGCTKRFKTQEFVPGQEVVLYAEVENFISEPTPKGFHTSLRSSYQIFDSRGQPVGEHEFGPTEEYCQNLRRDFFIGYHLRLPKRVYPGKHTLQLTIEDLKGHKVGQSSIELTIKDPEGDRD